MADANMRIIISAIDNASAELGKVKSALNGISGSGADASDSTKNFEKTSGVSFSKIAGYVASVTTALYAMKKAYNFAEQGAQITTLRNTATNYTNVLGGNFEQMVKVIRSSSMYTINEFDAMQSAANAMMLGLGTNTEKLGQLVEVAAYRGRLAGLTTTEAFNDIVRGIGRLSPQILDNLGITIDAENRYANYAEELGKTSTQLTSTEKRQALLNGVIEESLPLIEKAGGLTAQAVTPFEVLSAAAKEGRNTWKERMGGWANTLLGPMAALQQLRNLQNEGIITSEQFTEQYNKMFAAGYDYADVMKWVAQAVKEYNATAVRGTASTGRLADAAGATDELIDSTSELNDTFGDYILKIGLAGDLTKMQADYFDDLAKGGDVATAAMSNLSKSTAKWVRETAAAFGGFSATQELDIAFAFGEIDTTSYAAALAIQKYVESMQAAGASMPEMIGGLQAIKGNLDGLLTGGSATYTIDYVIRVLYQGVNVPFNLAANSLGLSASQAASALSWTLKAKASGANVGGTVFGNISQKALGGAVRKKALGGAVRTGEPYLVGEVGPELFVPQDNGTIIPNNKMANVGGKNVTIQITYAPTISTASESELEWALKPMIQRALREA